MVHITSVQTPTAANKLPMLRCVLTCPCRAAKQHFGDEAVLNHLPDGSLNPLRFTLRHNTEKTSTHRGKLYRMRTCSEITRAHA
jgi:hypothetical protein